MPRAETVTILFTNVVDSTALLERAGDEQAQLIVKTHQRLLREAVDSHGGHEVKWMGDGLMVAFPSAVDALRCAIGIQQSSRRPSLGERVQVRVGLHVGEALRDEADYFGTTVVIAKRLCDSATAGQIIASDVVAGLVAGRREFGFYEVGPLSLKGITDPIGAYELRYEIDVRAMLARTPFIGRAAEWSALLRMFERARSGEGVVVALVGEAGIGKTRTAEEFCEHARAAGATVLWGRCYDGDSSPPYSPFSEAINQFAAVASADVLGAIAPDDVALLSQIAPTLGKRTENDRQRPDSDGDRHGLLRAAADLIAGIAARQPLVLVLDDLHWADRGTVAMLEVIARDIRHARVLILVTYRDVEVGEGHPLTAATAGIRREIGFERIQLAGLHEDAVEALIGVVADGGAPPQLARALASDTGGNPFFIREMLLHLVEEGALDGSSVTSPVEVPEGARDVISRRLTRLSAGCNRLLTTCAAFTACFSWEEIRSAHGEGDEATMDALDEALAARLFREDEGSSYEFAHALIRQSLYEQLSRPRRRALHERIGEALERVHGTRIDEHLSDLAHHFYEAASPNDGNTERAVQYCRRAADRAAAVAAFEDAVALIEKALRLSPEPSEQRARLLERCADLAYMSGIDWERGTSALEEALQIYETAGEHARIPHVHSRLGRALSSMHPRRDIPQATEHYRAAVEMLQRGPHDVAFGYAKLGVANAALFNVETRTGIEASGEALELAEHLGHEALWANAATLRGFHLVNSGRPREGIDTIERAWATADRIDHASAAFVSAWQGGHVLARLALEPLSAVAILERELAKPRVAQAALQQRMLKGMLIDARLLHDEVAVASVLDTETGGQSQSFLAVQAFENRLDEAATRASAWLDNARQGRNKWNGWMYQSHLATILSMQGDLDGANELLGEALDIVVQGGNAAGELLVLSMIVRLRAAQGRPSECNEHAARCREIAGGDTGWRGAAGHAQLASAIVAAAQGDEAGATDCFRTAVQTYSDFGAQHDRVEATRLAEEMLGPGAAT